jgi:predicted ABC-type transport system involved in lysophospholipase L1 biosynthesis ATPase subunit
MSLTNTPPNMADSGDSDAPVIEATGLRMSYPSGDGRIVVLDGVGCRVTAGTSLSIRGESGCGKTTLLNLLAGLETPDAGEINWAGASIRDLGRGGLARQRACFIGMVFQSFYLIPELNALDNVLMPARIAGRIGPSQRARASDLLARVGLAERRHHVPAHLSGGERQRVAVARALMNQPKVVLADEPTGNLDEATGEGVMTVLLDVCSEQRASLVVVTHNAAHAARTAQQAYLSRQHLRLQ